MMKQTTRHMLDMIAEAAVDGLKAEAGLGLATPEAVAAAKARSRNPTPAGVVKTMIRSDVNAVRAMLGEGAETPLLRTMTNVMKTKEQFDYLAEGIDARMKKRAAEDEVFGAIYKVLFKPAKKA